MPCYHPLTGWQTKTGKITINWNPDLSGKEPMTVPCMNCIGCRIERSRAWAIRCSHEAMFHDESMFVTLTYRDQDLPWSGSLQKDAITLFIRRLKKHLKHTKKIRYFGCGEYGDKNERPHYHLLVFGHTFPDAELWKETDQGNRLYISPTLEKLWPYGMSNFGAVTYQSAAYTARYIMKKINGEKAEEHYKTDLEQLDQETGELTPVMREPEFVVASRRPGLGHQWIEKYWQDVYPWDHIIHDGKKHPVPRYYDKWMESHHPKVIQYVREKREQFAQEHDYDYTAARLADREYCKYVQLERLKRELDDSENLQHSRPSSRRLPTAVFHAHGRHSDPDIR